MDHVRWLDEPSLHRPTLIAAFTGWNDAGDAASNAVRHLVEAWNAKALAEIDPEEFTDFATVRPHVRLRPDRSRQIVWPTVGLWHASTPGGDVILLLGPEPALRWRLFTEQVTTLAARQNVSMVITLGALLAVGERVGPHEGEIDMREVPRRLHDEVEVEALAVQRSHVEGDRGAGEVGGPGVWGAEMVDVDSVRDGDHLARP